MDVRSSTPSQVDAMESNEAVASQQKWLDKELSSTESKNVKVDTISVANEVPMHSKLAHVLAIVVAGTIALAVSSVLADGTSVIKLKPPAELPIATEKSLKDQGIKYRLDELLGPTYGIGLHHDQSGRTWTEIGAGSTVKELVKNLGVPVIAGALPGVIAHDGLKHPVPLLACDDLQKAGLAAMSLGFIAEAVAVVMVLFHALALAGLLPAKIAKPLGSLVWFVLTTGFLTVIMIAVGVYTATWECDNIVIPSLKISDHFDYNYGFGYAIIGFVASLLILMVTLCITSTTDGVAGAPAHKPSYGKLICGLLTGLVLGAALANMVAGANDGFASDPAPDPDYNPCAGKKPKSFGPGDKYFSNTACMIEEVAQTLEQAGANVTKGFKGELDAGDRVPITTTYDKAGLCPVNVHWHLGAEHLSVGEYDEYGTGPPNEQANNAASVAAATYAYDTNHTVRLGFRCHHYKESNDVFTKPYPWKYCKDMVVGETYEIHWPHSAAGACGTQHQYQTPFYDGVFCNDGIISIAPLNTYEKIGVQSQVFTVVNDDSYAHDDLIKGMVVQGNLGADMAIYTGSTTGTSRDNNICSRYTPITWQVDRKCHMIHAGSFDKLCKDMKEQKDDMTGDLHAHGARPLVAQHLVADNQWDSRK